MRRILITGANSYIGESFEKFMNQFEPYQIDTLDMLDEKWKNQDFSKYDTVFHVAGIAHIKETKENADLYYKVNRDLAVEVANKAKESGVKQFVFLSSMSVYGMNSGEITKKTVPSPVTNYGKSKLEAENKLKAIENDDFSVAIVRPPMVYGKNCKGNFPSLVRFIDKFRIFPKVDNQRSMIYIDNLCAFVKILIDSELHGVFMPQNNEYVKTCSIAEIVAKKTGKKVYFSVLLGMVVAVARVFVPVVKKAFGSLVYKDTEDFDYSYCLCDVLKSIEKSL